MSDVTQYEAVNDAWVMQEDANGNESIVVIEPVVVEEPVEDRPFTCTERGCTASYRLPQHLGLHKYHKHGVRGVKNKNKSNPPSAVKKEPALPKLPRVQCEVCHIWVHPHNVRRHMKSIHGEEDEATPVVITLVTAEEITRTAAVMLWPNGIPHEVLDALLQWNTHTENFLVAVRPSITGREN